MTASKPNTALTRAFREIGGPIFAALWADETQRTLVVHAALKSGQVAFARQIKAALKPVTDARIKVRFHHPDVLALDVSLERLVARFGAGTLVYDPTEAVGRAMALVRTSARLRETMGGQLFGLYFAPKMRAFHVVLKGAGLVNDRKVKLADLTAIRGTVVAALRDAFAGREDTVPSVRIGFGLPATALVAVDTRSAPRGQGMLTWLKGLRWRATAIAALFGAGLTVPAAAEGPAVDGTSLKISGNYGEVEDEETWDAFGSLTTPLSERMGLQVDGAYLDTNDIDAWGTGAHLFWRDPEEYLVGFFGAYVESDVLDLEVGRAGVEFEFYLDQITLAGRGGAQIGDISEGGFAGADITFYATDNFALSAGGEVMDDNAYAQFQAEWQPGISALPGLAFNARGVLGEDDYDEWTVGLTYYFGKPASLKQRHRTQDPDTALQGLFQAVKIEQARIAAYNEIQ